MVFPIFSLVDWLSDSDIMTKLSKVIAGSLSGSFGSMTRIDSTRCSEGYGDIAVVLNTLI